MPSNDQRSQWADHALTIFQTETRCDREDALPDLLCDLIHLADREGWDFARALHRAKSHYRDEINYPEPDFLPRPAVRRATRVPT